MGVCEDPAIAAGTAVTIAAKWSELQEAIAFHFAQLYMATNDTFGPSL